MKPATCGVKVVDVHAPAADGRVTGTFAQVVPADPGASPPAVESYVEDRAPAGSFRFVGHRIRVRRLDGYTRQNDGEQEFSSPPTTSSRARARAWSAYSSCYPHSGK
jgi:hypothetical protein